MIEERSIMRSAWSTPRKLYTQRETKADDMMSTTFTHTQYVEDRVNNVKSTVVPSEARHWRSCRRTWTRRFSRWRGIKRQSCLSVRWGRELPRWGRDQQVDHWDSVVWRVQGCEVRSKSMRRVLTSLVRQRWQGWSWRWRWWTGYQVRVREWWDTLDDSTSGRNWRWGRNHWRQEW